MQFFSSNLKLLIQFINLNSSGMGIFDFNSILNLCTPKMGHSKLRIFHKLFIYYYTQKNSFLKKSDTILLHS